MPFTPEQEKVLREAPEWLFTMPDARLVQAFNARGVKATAKDLRAWAK